MLVLPTATAAADSSVGCGATIGSAAHVGGTTRISIGCLDHTGAPVTLVVSRAPRLGTTSGFTPALDYDQRLTYTAPATAVLPASDDFEVTATSPNGSASTEVSVRLVAADVNTPPTCNDETLLGPTGFGVQLWCWDPDGDPVVTELVDRPVGSFTKTADDPLTYSYTFPRDFTGTDRVTYRAHDPYGAASELATITFKYGCPAFLAMFCTAVQPGATPTVTPGPDGVVPTVAPPPVNPPTASLVAPRLTASVPKQPTRRIFKRGLRVRLGCDAGCRMDVTVSLKSRIVGRAAAVAAGLARVKLDRSVRRAARRAGKLTVRVLARSAAGATSHKTLTVALD